MFEQINQALRTLLTRYLASKFDVSSVVDLLQPPEVLVSICTEFDSAISAFNRFRTDNFPPYLVNSIELSRHFDRELPMLGDIKLTDQLISEIGRQLRDDSYFVEVWKIEDPYELLCNLILLLYRNYLLTKFSSELVGPNGTRKVQISSSIEEMVFQLEMGGHLLMIRRAFIRWLQDWREEGFSEELHRKVVAASQTSTS